MEKVNTVYLSIGSNIGDRLANLQKAVDLLQEKNHTILESSGIYETDAFEFESSDRFLNAALKIQTQNSPIELLADLKRIEMTLGRTQRKSGEPYQSRIIDLDIIFFNSLSVDSTELCIPHPRFHERIFVLQPLNDIISTEERKLSQLVESHLMKVQDSQTIDKTNFSLIH
jgi:2-amino-4-hydroxy-6-hydroxymethyldihydropteridine diphosphokinase